MGLARGARATGTLLERIVREILEVHLDIPLAARAVNDLRLRRIYKPVFRPILEKLELLLSDLPRLGQTLQYRSRKLDHLFGEGLKKAAKNAQRNEYFRLCDALVELARTTEFEKLLKPRGPRGRVQAQARIFMLSLSGVVDRYGDLKRESYALNALTRRLYGGRTVIGYADTAKRVPIYGPLEYLSLRVDAQHIVEQRAFGRWKNDWALLGWESEADMPAMAIMHEWHIRSPKGLMGMDQVVLDDTKPIEDVFSLTGEMLRDLKLEQFKTPEEYLKALKKFYDVRVVNKSGVEVRPLKDLANAVDAVLHALEGARKL